jgi:hypothetical protein
MYSSTGNQVDHKPDGSVSAVEQGQVHTRSAGRASVRDVAGKTARMLSRGHDRDEALRRASALLTAGAGGLRRPCNLAAFGDTASQGCATNVTLTAQAIGRSAGSSQVGDKAHSAPTQQIQLAALESSSDLASTPNAAIHPRVESRARKCTTALLSRPGSLTLMSIGSAGGTSCQQQTAANSSQQPIECASLTLSLGS